jgi:hypothetical protein
MLRSGVALFALGVFGAAAQSPEQTYGLITSASAQGVRIRPKTQSIDREAAAGDFLFEGDTLWADTKGAAQVVWCGGSGGYEFTFSAGSLIFNRQPPNVPGRVQAPVCKLPALEREPDPSLVISRAEMEAPTSLKLRPEQLEGLGEEARNRLAAMNTANLENACVRLTYAVELQQAGFTDLAAQQYLALAATWDRMRSDRKGHTQLLKLAQELLGPDVGDLRSMRNSLPPICKPSAARPIG